MRTDSEKLEIAQKKKYYEFTYQYTRSNPQLGNYKTTSTVIAATEKEAEKLAKISCDKAIYGWNSFDCIVKKSEQLKLGEDYELTIQYLKRDQYGYPRGSSSVVARKIYK